MALAYRRTDMTKLTGVFRVYANAPETYTIYKSTLCARMWNFSNVKPGGPYSNRYNLKGKGKVHPFHAKKTYRGVEL